MINIGSAILALTPSEDNATKSIAQPGMIEVVNLAPAGTIPICSGEAQTSIARQNHPDLVDVEAQVLTGLGRHVFHPDS
jgi:hypothetical protein